MKSIHYFLGKFRSFSTLQIALGVSIIFHTILLTIRFVDPESFNRVFQDTPLEVILVNARSDEKPTKAQAIAQHNLAGGGEAEAGRATTFLATSELTALGEASVDTSLKMNTLQEQQMLLLAQLKAQIALLPVPEPNKSNQSPEAQAQEEKRRKLSKFLGEIEQRISQENARPKKRYISPATREEVYALYYDQLKQKIEAKGTANFPEIAGKKLYGDLTIILTVNHDGRILASEVVQSSGNLALDRRALAIANASGPFGAFTPAMRRGADEIVMVSQFRFTRDAGLKTKLTQQ